MSWVKRKVFRPLEKFFPEIIANFDSFFTFVFKELHMVMKISHVNIFITLLNVV